MFRKLNIPWKSQKLSKLNQHFTLKPITSFHQTSAPFQAGLGQFLNRANKTSSLFFTSSSHYQKDYGYQQRFISTSSCLQDSNKNNSLIKLSQYEEAANQGDADAQYRLGRMYRMYNLEKAIEWYEKAANQGHAEAQFELGYWYSINVGGGLKRAADMQKAFGWYEKAANRGHLEAQYRLAEMYEKGRGVAKNTKQAKAWYEKAAKQGHERAQLMLNLNWLVKLEKKQSISTLPLLKWVAEGQLVETEKLLKQDPQLALARGMVTDLSDRAFDNITAFQYSVWSLDSEMWEIILKYLAPNQAALQLHELQNDRHDIIQKYGLHFDFDPLLKAYQIYIDNFSLYDYMWCEQHWRKVVGGEQRKVPAWYVYAFCELGEEVTWTVKDFRKPIKREYEEGHVAKWFDNSLGDEIGYARDTRDVPYIYDRIDNELVISDGNNLYHKHGNEFSGKLTDHENTKFLKLRQLDQLTKLQAKLQNEMTTLNRSKHSFTFQK